MLGEKVECGYVKKTPEIERKLRRREIEDVNIFMHVPRQVHNV